MYITIVYVMCYVRIRVEVLRRFNKYCSEENMWSSPCTVAGPPACYSTQYWVLVLAWTNPTLQAVLIISALLLIR